MYVRRRLVCGALSVGVAVAVAQPSKGNRYGYIAVDAPVVALEQVRGTGGPERDWMAAAIGQAVRNYVEKRVRANDFEQSGASMLRDLKKILPGDLDGPPLSFGVDSSSGRSEAS